MRIGHHVLSVQAQKESVYYGYEMTQESIIFITSHKILWTAASLKGVTFDLYSMRAILQPYEDVWHLNIVVASMYGAQCQDYVCVWSSHLCMFCWHELKATVDWAQLLASCLSLTVLSFQHRSVWLVCQPFDILSKLFFNISSSLSVKQLLVI